VADLRASVRDRNRGCTRSGNIKATRPEHSKSLNLRACENEAAPSHPFKLNPSIRKPKIVLHGSPEGNFWNFGRGGDASLRSKIKHKAQVERLLFTFGTGRTIDNADENYFFLAAGTGIRARSCRMQPHAIEGTHCVH
jgi:hypothetical protein